MPCVKLMNEIKGDIWSFASPTSWIVIPTNGITKKNGDAVMGAGLAKQAALKFALLPQLLGDRLNKIGNYVYYFMDYRVVTFPTKHHWKDPSDIELIIKGACQLGKDADLFQLQEREVHYFLPKIGCGLGGLEWHNVANAICPYLNRPEFTIVCTG